MCMRSIDNGFLPPWFDVPSYVSKSVKYKSNYNRVNKISQGEKNDNYNRKIDNAYLVKLDSQGLHLIRSMSSKSELMEWIDKHTDII